MQHSSWGRLLREDKTPFILAAFFTFCAIIIPIVLRNSPLLFLTRSLTDLSLLFLLIALLARARRGSSKQKPFWKLILGISFIVWLISFWIGSSLIYNGRALLSWQFVVISSWLFGYYYHEVLAYWQKFSFAKRKLIVLLTTVFVVMALMIYFLLLAKNMRYVAFLLYNYIYLSPFLLILFTGWIGLFYHFSHYIEDRIKL